VSVRTAYNAPVSNLLHLRQRERERLQERRDQVYDELQPLHAQLDQAKQRAQALEQEFAELRRIGELEEAEIGAVLPGEE
jgi:predicted  nucleic acid-binding Zn-ribbon protein